MSDFFSSLFSGAGGGDGSSTDFAPTGGQGGGDFLSSMFGGQSGGDLSSAIGGMGMGNFDPSQLFQQNPQQAVAQGGDPGGQLAASQGQGQDGQGQGPGGQQGQGGQGQRNPIGDFFKIFGDALTGKMQQPGYTPLGGLAQQANAGQQLPQQPGFDQPANTTDSTRIKVPGEMPAGPAGPPQIGQPPGQSQAAQAKGEEAGGLAPGQATEEAPIPPKRPSDLGPAYADESQHGMGTGQPTATPGAVPARLGGGGAPPGAGGTQAGGGQQGFGQFMQSPLGQLVQGLIGQMLGRMGPGGQMLAQMLSPMLSQLAGQAGQQGMMGGPGQSRWNPETPAIDRGGDWMNRAMPGGAAGVLKEVERRESGGRNLAPWQNGQYQKDVAAGRAPTSHASGYYQFQPRTWQTWAQRSGIGTQYREAYLAPKAVQDQVAAYALQHTRGGANSPSLWGASSRGGTYPSIGGSSASYASLTPNYGAAQRRRRRDMAMGWQF